MLRRCIKRAQHASVPPQQQHAAYYPPPTLTPHQQASPPPAYDPHYYYYNYHQQQQQQQQHYTSPLRGEAHSTPSSSSSSATNHDGSRAAGGVGPSAANRSSTPLAVPTEADVIKNHLHAATVAESLFMSNLRDVSLETGNNKKGGVAWWSPRRWRMVVPVPEGHLAVVERLGRYNRQLAAGWWPLLPVIDNVKFVYCVGQVPLSLPPIVATTADGESISIYGARCQVKLHDALKASYDVARLSQSWWTLLEGVVRGEVATQVLDRNNSNGFPTLRLQRPTADDDEAPPQQQQDKAEELKEPVKTTNDTTATSDESLPRKSTEGDTTKKAPTEATSSSSSATDAHNDANEAIGAALSKAFAQWGLELTQWHTGHVISNTKLAQLKQQQEEQQQQELLKQQTQAAVRNVSSPTTTGAATVAMEQAAVDAAKYALVQRAAAEAESFELLCAVWRKNQDVASEVVQAFGSTPTGAAVSMRKAEAATSPLSSPPVQTVRK